MVRALWTDLTRQEQQNGGALSFDTVRDEQLRGCSWTPIELKRRSF
jgi:hypothetical protein